MISKSMMRPAMKGPRSLTTQVVVFPLETLVTVTAVPIGSVLCAQPPALWE